MSGAKVLDVDFHAFFAAPCAALDGDDGIPRGWGQRNGGAVEPHGGGDSALLVEAHPAVFFFEQPWFFVRFHAAQEQEWLAVGFAERFKFFVGIEELEVEFAEWGDGVDPEVWAGGAVGGQLCGYGLGEAGGEFFKA